MAGRPPTPPNDEEMEDIPRPAAAGPIGAGAGPAPAADPNYIANVKSSLIRLIKTITDIQKDLERFHNEDDPDALANIRNTIQQKLNALDNDDDWKEYFRREYKHLEGVSRNGQLGKDAFYDEVEFDLRVTKGMLSSIAEGLGISDQELQGGKRRKTRRNRKSLRKRTNGRKTSHTSKR